MSYVSLSDIDHSNRRKDIPEHVWSRRLNALSPSQSIHKPSTPPITEIVRLLPLVYRLKTYISEEKKNNREPIFDLNGIALQPPDPGPWSGVPCGGLGSGAIGRGYRGDFRRWSIHPGKYIHRIVPTNQFSIRIKNCLTGEVISKVLSIIPPDDTNYCSSWNWTMSSDCASYYALFPRAWHIYTSPIPGVNVTIRQVSPFIPNNYSDSSLPTSLFHVNVTNTSEDSLEVSVMFTWENNDGSDSLLGDVSHKPFIIPNHSNRLDDHIYGVQMNNQLGSFAIATQAVNSSYRVSYSSQFLTKRPDNERSTTSSMWKSFSSTINSSTYISTSSITSITNNIPHNPTAVDIWRDFTSTGDLSSNDFSDPHISTTTNCHVAAGICINYGILSSNDSTDEISIAIAWDHPIVRFGPKLNNKIVVKVDSDESEVKLSNDSSTRVPRYYSRFFGLSGENASTIASYALIKANDWENEIINWQNKEINISNESDKREGNPDVPGFYKHHLFNELYYLVDGGSVWVNSSRELSLQFDYKCSIFLEDSTMRVMIGEGCIAQRKVLGVIPHDLGSPYESPWVKTNAYNFQDVSQWKDLGSKFILQIYRNYIYLSNHYKSFDCESLAKVYLINYIDELKHIIGVMISFDRDNDGMIENDGFPDQTYDIWIATGVSVYSGGLYLSALICMLDVCKLFDLQDDYERLYDIVNRGIHVYYNELYDNSNQYFRYDNSKNSYSDSIMSDMLIGQFYNNICRSSIKIVPNAVAVDCINTIYSNNVLKVKQGNRFIGAMNGMKPIRYNSSGVFTDSVIDDTCIQSREVWT
eukprot:gene21912-28371_t